MIFGFVAHINVGVSAMDGISCQSVNKCRVQYNGWYYVLECQ